ncbi:glycerophosphodiester phosphodiesterase [Pararhodobacter sp.]|uniref:glycerophosphodiester phosphodiesterase n=1 Tax=Pararhodobacter sp. TaxID=2127056 RepID=UPI002AFE4A07|nr:glycerophosphodiester phosphodiesterase [Pararhodobacter sp.]
MTHGWLDHPGPVAIAHRGGSLENDENTMPAFAHAVALGYRHIETDVHLTADGAVVIHHDPTLERLTGDPRPIAALTRRDLAQIRTHSGAPIPLLADLLEEFPELYVNIESKCDAVVEPLAQLVTRMRALPRIGTGSFAGARTARLRALLGQDLCWSPSLRGALGLWLTGWGLPLPRGGFPMVQVPRQFRGIEVVTPRFLRAARHHGIRVQVWTVNEAEDMQTLLDMGVDGVMTDRPSLLKQILIDRGEWRNHA